jgi:hypothetical protein
LIGQVFVTKFIILPIAPAWTIIITNAAQSWSYTKELVS